MPDNLNVNLQKKEPRFGFLSFSLKSIGAASALFNVNAAPAPNVAGFIILNRKAALALYLLPDVLFTVTMI